MATETYIPESVYLKISDNALSSEILGEKVTELQVGNIVKHVESSNQMAETVNKQVEAGIPTNESGTFFQTLSVPMVTSNTPQSVDAVTTKDQDPEFVKTSESVEDHTEDITPGVEIKEKPENQGLHDNITTDACVSTPAEAEGETIENEKKNDDEAIEKEACEQKDESAVGLILSDSMALSKKEALNTLEQNQDETSEEIKEKTPGQSATPVADTKEQDLNEFVKEETKDKPADAQQAIEQLDIVEKTEQEEETEEIKPSVEIEEKMDAITTDACISTQTKSPVENTEHEEKDEEEATPSDDAQKEKSDISSIKDVCDENSSEKVEYESSGLAIVNNDEDEEREQEVSVLEKDKGEDVVTSARDVSFEGNEEEINVLEKESIEEDTKQIKSSVETTEVCISTQTKPEEETAKNEEKNDEETIESDDGQTKKSGSHMVKETCEDTVSEKTESLEGFKPSDSSCTTLNETEIVSKDVDQEKEQELNVSEKDQTESQVKTTKMEQVDEEVIESEDGQKENSDSHSITEVCEETESEKIESGKEEIYDRSSIKINEKVITSLSNDEVQEKEQDQGEDEVTLHDVTNTDVFVSTQAEPEKETTENEEENDEKAIEKEVCDETSPEKAEPEVGLQLSDNMAPSKEEDLDTVEKDQDDSAGVTISQDTTFEDLKETTPGHYAATVADFKEEDVNEFVKEETENKSTDVQQASEECEIGGNDKIEQMPEESVKHEDQENKQEVNILEKDQRKDEFASTQEVSVEEGIQEKNHHSEDIEREIVKEKESIDEDTQQHSLINAIPTDVCISTQTEPYETPETQEKNDEEAVESNDGQTKKSGNPMVEQICEETEKVESEEGSKLSNSTSLALDDHETVSKDEDQEKVQELNVSEKDQIGENDATSSQNAPNVDVEETTIGHVSTVVDVEEIAVDKAIDAQEASEQHKERANDNREQNPEDSIKDIVHSKVEHEDYIEEIKPSVETNEEKDVCISTQTESREEAAKNEEKAIEGDDDLKETSEIPFVKEVCEETDVKKTESEEEVELSKSSKMILNEKAVAIISKDENQEEEQEPKSAVFEDELQGKNDYGECNEHEVVQTGESIKGDEDIRTNDETEELTEQQGSVHAITSDVSILTQKESQEDTTQNEENNVEPIESEDGLKEKHDIPSVKEVCEGTSLEKVESKEELELHDNTNMKIIEKTITFKDEDQEKDQEINMPEEGQGKDNVTSSHDEIPKEEEELEQKNFRSESNETELVNTIENVDEEIKSSVEEKEDSEQQGLSQVTTNDVCSSTQAKEETIENEAKLDAESIADRTEDKSEMEDEVVLIEKMSSKEKAEEIEASLTKATEDEVTKKDEDSSHINIQDSNDEGSDIKISTLEHGPTEEQNIGLDEVSKEKFTDLNETTAVEPQDTPPSLFEPSTQDTSNLEKAKAESEILPIDDLESVTEIQIPEVVPILEDAKPVSVTAVHLDEEKETVTDEISCDEKTEQPTEIKKETLEEVCEETSLENETEIVSKDEDQEKEQEVNMIEKAQGEDEITSAQDVVFEGGVEERKHHSEGNEQEVVTMEERVVEDIEEIKCGVEEPSSYTNVSISTQIESEEKTNEIEEKNDEKAVCEEIVSEKVESEEGLKLSDSPSMADNENEIESKDEDQETGEGLYVSEKGQGGEEDFLSSKNASVEDIRESTNDQHATIVANFEEEKGESAVTEEIIKEKAQDHPIDAQEMSELEQPKEQNANEKTEDEITKKDEHTSHDNMEDTSDKTMKEEKCTLEHEPVEEQDGRSFDEVSKESVMDLNDTTALEPQEDITLSGTLGTLTEVAANSEKEKAKTEVLPTEDLESVSEIQIPEEVIKSEDLNLKEECLESATEVHVDEDKGIATEENTGDEKIEQTIEIKKETFEEVCEETISEKAELEGSKLSDSSNITINEKVMTSLCDEDQEKGQEVNVSTEGQSKGNVTSSNDTAFEKEVLQEKNYEYEDSVPEFDETRESIDKDTKEIKSSVETKEQKSESPLVTKVCEATSLEKAELEEDVNHSESFNTKVVEDETVSNEENLEIKQELPISEVQGGGDDVISSDNVSNEDIKEPTIGQRETTVVDFEEKQALSETTKEILVEEAAEDKSVDAQEVSERCNEAEDKSEQNLEESVEKPVKSCVEIVERNITEDDANEGNNKEIEPTQDEENQAERTDDKGEVKDEIVSTEKMPSEFGQPKEQNIEEIESCLTETVTEKTEDEITKKEDLSQETIADPNDSTTREENHPLEHIPAEEQHHGGVDEVSKENITNLYETTAVEPQEDITPSNSLGTKAESENLPTEDLESVSEVQIPEVVPKSEDVNVKDECLVSEAATTEILSDENSEAYGERELTEENVSQSKQIGDNDSPYEKTDKEEDDAQETHLNEECGEMVKDVILTEKISNREVTEVREDTQIVQEDLQAEEDISCELNAQNDSIDEAPKEQIIPSLEEVKTIEPEVDVANIESTAYPSESEKLPTPALESVCDVQTREVSADSEDQEVKEECIVLATEQHTDDNRVEEEQKNITNEILSVPEEESVKQVPDKSSVKQVPDKSDEGKSDLNTEEKASTEESLELQGELEPTFESIIEEDKVNKIEPQPEQSDIASENITYEQESKLENMTEKDLEDGQKDMEEDLILAPENQIKSIENQTEIMKNVIVTDEVSEKDNCPTELDKTSTSNEKELASEQLEILKPMEVANTEVTTEAKAENEIEVENIQPADDLSCVSNASSTIIGEVKDDSLDEASKDEIIPVLETESTDTHSSEQETAEEKDVFVTPLTNREILEAPDTEYEKKERDGELISDVLTPEAILETEVKEEHPEATNDTCETLMGGESSEKKLESMGPPEVLTSPMVEDQANELVSETDKSNVELSSISNADQNPKFIKERSTEEEGKGNFAVENTEEKSGNEVVEDVIVSQVLLEDETAKESKSIKDNINEEAIYNQLTSPTDDVCENERSNTSSDELVEKKDSVEDTKDPKLMAENLNVKDEPFTVMKASKEDDDLVTPEIESLENIATDEKIIKTDANEEKETQDEPQAYDPAQTTSDSITSSIEQDVEVRSGDSIEFEEKPNEVSDVIEIVSEGREASEVLTENIQEAYPDMIIAEHDPEITTATEKTDDKKVECIPVEKTGELQVSTLNSEIDEGKQNVPDDMPNKEREAVQPQESSEDNTLLSQNDNKFEDSFVLPSAEKDTKQGVDTRFEEAPVIDVLKNEKGLDHTTDGKTIDVVSNAECLEVKPLHLDTKEVTSELINQEKKTGAEDNIDVLIPVEDVKSSTIVKCADLEVPSAMDSDDKKDVAYEAEKEELNDGMHLESTGDRSKPIEEVSEMKQELDAPATLGTGVIDDLKITQKNLTDDLTLIATQPEIQKEVSAACTVEKQSLNEPIAKSLISEVQDLKASSTAPQCSSEVLKEDEKTSEGKEMLPEPTKVISEAGDQNIIGEREVALTKDAKVDKEENGDEENEEEEEGEENEKTGDAPVMVEASKDMEVKAHKKSHNILSGVGSKVKHSIAKVKKAITGKSSHPKPPSP